MSTTRKKNNIFKVILSGVTAAVIIAASAGCGTVDLNMGKNNKNSSDNSVVEVIMPAQTTTTVTTTAVTTEVPLPVKSYGDDFVRCNAAICYDLTDGKVIYSKNAGKRCSRQAPQRYLPHSLPLSTLRPNMSIMWAVSWGLLRRIQVCRGLQKAQAFAETRY